MFAESLLLLCMINSLHGNVIEFYWKMHGRIKLPGNCSSVLLNSEESTSNALHLTTDFKTGPQGMIWSYTICPMFDTHDGSLEECKDKCLQNDGCTAFNFGPDWKHSCELLKCPVPVPEPTWNWGRGWIGYYRTTVDLKPKEKTTTASSLTTVDLKPKDKTTPASSLTTVGLKPKEKTTTTSSLTKENCPDDYFTPAGTKRCLKIYLDTERTWIEAHLKCQAENSIMAITSDDDATVIRKDIAENRGNEFVWLAAKSNGNKFVWARNNEEISNYNSLWYTDDITKELKSGNCIMFMSTGTYVRGYPGKTYWPRQCAYKSAYTLCEYDPTQSYNECPLGYFKPIGSRKCIKIYYDRKRSWSAAKDKCEVDDAQLAMTHNDDEALLISKFIYDVHVNKQGEDTLWIGAKGTGERFDWEDGTPIANTNPLWYFFYPYDYQSDDYCLEFKALYSSHSSTTPYRAGTCTSSSAFTLCEIPEDCSPFCQNDATCNDDRECECTTGWKGDACDAKANCPDGYFGLAGSKRCLKIYLDTERTWIEAHLKCQAENSVMARTSDEDSTVIRKFIVDFYGNEFVWLAAKSNGNKYVWARDNEEISNDNSLWKTDDITKQLASGYCIVFLSTDTYVKGYPEETYLPRHCKFKSAYTLCEYDPSQPKNNCPLGYFKPIGTTKCLKVLADRKRTWSAAKDQCEDDDAQLAQMSDEDAILIRDYITDVYGSDSLWIGGKGTGASFKWEDGTEIPNTNPLWSWTPTTTDSYCLEFQKSSRPYKSITCTSSANVLCESKQMGMSEDAE